jgi:hypothetical protein
MALSKAEREQLAALTQKAKASEEEESGFEIHVRRGNSDRVVTLRGKQAKAYMVKHGLDEDDVEQPETEQEPEEEDEDEKDEPAAGGGGYFKSRRA